MTRCSRSVPSWAWRGQVGTKAVVEVYSDADEVELRLNDPSIGRKPAGKRTGNVARFTLPWAEGALTAIAYRNGVEVSRSTERSTVDALQLTLRADRPEYIADGQDAAFVSIEVTDAAGTVEQLADDEIELELEGAATLVGFGSAAPTTTETFTDLRHSTDRRRVLALLRSTGALGLIHLTARSARHGEARIELHFNPSTARADA